MIIKTTNDGAVIDNALIDEFHLNKTTDLYNYTDVENTNQEPRNSIKFVGFVTNSDNNSLVVFPKHFSVIDKQSDADLLFKVINLFMRKHITLYTGEKIEDTFVSNFPFAPFFKIYEYYQKFGLHIEDASIIKPTHGSSLNWKYTIKNAKKYLVDGSIVIMPFFYNDKVHQATFLTDCMIYAIEYTLDKFSYFIHLPRIKKATLTVDYLKHKNATIARLNKIKQTTFRDSTLMLIDSLIQFYSSLNIGGEYYLKFYNFSSVWENMVLNYLNKYFVKVDNGIVLDKAYQNDIKFTKPSFHPNKANPSQAIQPDYYFAAPKYQLIFDAKYYSSITGIDYKQIGYYLFLNERTSDETGTVPDITYSALILPADKRETKTHFKMSELYNHTYADLVIYEEYFDIREVMMDYIAKS